MKRLHFIYGVMGSSKSARAVMQAYEANQKKLKPIVLKSKIDTREDSPVIKSRSGLRFPCTLFDVDANLLDVIGDVEPTQIVIVDEAQFCTKEQINQLKQLTINKNVEVFCYGLKTNFKTELFEGSKRLLELADCIEEVESVCRCGKKPIANARIVNRRVVTTGDEVQIGSDESYEGLCYECYEKYQHEDLPKLQVSEKETDNIK